LVRLTTSHDPPDGDANGAVLCDADLVVLARPEREYAAYVAAVRAEYAKVGDDDFRKGRAAVVAGLLRLPALYRTAHGSATWEDAARRNLSRELDELRVASQAP
jgi:predicted metal-dependent HD superfamily phosphohydrolase